MTEQLNVPKLRFFPEKATRFSDWEVKSFDEVFKRITRKNGENNQNVLTISAQYGLINQQKYFNKAVAAKDVTGYYLLKNGDFAYNKSYSKGYPMGAIKRLNNYDKGVVSTLYICFNINLDNNPQFFEQYFESGSQNKELAKIAQEGARNHGLLNISVVEFFKDINLRVPTLPEQQKIASFLSKVDEKIGLLTEKKDKLTEYKKGVMQQLFNGKWENQNGQLTFIPPTLRFKAADGSKFPDWEEKKLGDFTQPVKRKATEAVSKVMTISASQGFLDQKERFSQIIAGSSLDRYTHIRKGEFSYNRGNSKTFKYGCIYLMRDEEALVPFVYRTFKLLSGVPEFYQQFFLNHVLDRQLRKMISSSARMDGLLNIGEKDFYKVKLLVPTIDEQTKIANFLSTIDQKIDLANSELEKAKDWKKGLLQQMFV
ncbi:TPA: restriction endonuclease subunit S [Photobacterium damselae]